MYDLGTVRPRHDLKPSQSMLVSCVCLICLQFLQSSIAKLYGYFGYKVSFSVTMYRVLCFHWKVILKHTEHLIYNKSIKCMVLPLK